MLLRNPLFKKTLLFISIALLITACGEEKKPKSQIGTSKEIVIKDSFKEKMSYKNSEDYMILENSCLYCHKLKDTNSSVAETAPYMYEIQEVYKKKYPVKDDFVKAIVDFKKNPQVDKILLKEALKKYGAMPEYEFTDGDTEDLKNIAAFLFDFKFE